MPTILETISTANRPWWELFPEKSRPLPLPVPETVVLDVTNVLRYIDANREQILTIGYLPLTPPWEQTWVEYHDPKRQVQLALVVTRVEIPPGMVVTDTTWAPGRARWMLVWSPLRRFDGEHPHHIQTGVQMVTYLIPDGSMLRGADIDGKPALLTYSAQFPGDLGVDKETFKLATQELLPDLAITQFAFALLNCKNVVVEDEVTPPKLAAKRLRKHGIPSITRKVLRVVPLAQAHRAPGAPVPVDHSPKALHIRRGYFGDYREGPGLFGKHHGVYWWDQALRGNSSGGEVIKSYELELPEV